MALNPNIIELFRRLPRRKGRVLTLGEQTVKFSSARLAEMLGQRDLRKDLTQTDVFEALGFDDVQSLDVSDYEGSDHIFDLNQPEAPAHLLGQYDMVFTGGTLEHVFHISQALQHAASFVRPGGCLVHLSPANNWMQHGFYQPGPEWLSAYFQQNGWQIEISAVIDVIDKTHWIVQPPRRAFRGIRQMLYGVGVRSEEATIDTAPVQNLYIRKHETDEDETRFDEFPAIEIHNGDVIDAAG